MDEPEVWTAVDEYIAERLLPDDPDALALLAAAEAAGLPQIQVSAPQGALLALLARSIGARRVLEVGTLGGYSTLWLARALPADGVVVTLELDPQHADVAAAALDAAGVGDKIDLRIGPALDTLDAMVADGADPFDLSFIDADKANNPQYVQRALWLSRPGSLIVVDNVVRGGAVIDAESWAADVVGTRALFDLLRDEPALEATAIQTVGGKGYDGFVLARVTA
jgi:predicted O-methyltransferase YrrM